MLRIRLSRVGKKKRPAYRIIVADSRSPRDGLSVDIIGHYDPLPDPAEIVIKEERAIHWLQVGAQPSEVVARLFTRLGIMEKAGRRPFLHTPVQAAQAKAKAAPAEATAPQATGEEAVSAPVAEETEPQAAEADAQPIPEPTE